MRGDSVGGTGGTEPEHTYSLGDAGGTLSGVTPASAAAASRDPCSRASPDRCVRASPGTRISPAPGSRSSPAAGSRESPAAGADDLCTICFVTPLGELALSSQLGKLDCCSHAYCFGCIGRWVDEVESSCPLCKRRVCELTRVGAGEVVLNRRPVAARVQQKPEATEAELQALADEADETYNCVVCGTGERDECILLCDSCDRG